MSRASVPPPFALGSVRKSPSVLAEHDFGGELWGVYGDFHPRTKGSAMSGYRLINGELRHCTIHWMCWEREPEDETRSPRSAITVPLRKGDKAPAYPRAVLMIHWVHNGAPARPTPEVGSWLLSLWPKEYPLVDCLKATHLQAWGMTSYIGLHGSAEVGEDGRVYRTDVPSDRCLWDQSPQWSSSPHGLWKKDVVSVSVSELFPGPLLTKKNKTPNLDLESFNFVPDIMGPSYYADVERGRKYIVGQVCFEGKVLLQTRFSIRFFSSGQALRLMNFVVEAMQKADTEAHTRHMLRALINDTPMPQWPEPLTLSVSGASSWAWDQYNVDDVQFAAALSVLRKNHVPPETVREALTFPEGEAAAEALRAKKKNLIVRVLSLQTQFDTVRAELKAARTELQHIRRLTRDYIVDTKVEND